MKLDKRENHCYHGLDTVCPQRSASFVVSPLRLEAQPNAVCHPGRTTLLQIDAELMSRVRNCENGAPPMPSTYPFGAMQKETEREV